MTEMRYGFARTTCACSTTPPNPEGAHSMSTQSLWDTLLYALASPAPRRESVFYLLEHLLDGLARGEPLPRMPDKVPLQFAFSLPLTPDDPPGTRPLTIPEEDFNRLLVEEVEARIAVDGLWQFVTLPGIYEALITAFSPVIEDIWRLSQPPDDEEPTP
jgi:hypothetical protein